MHTRAHESERPLENATENSGENPLEKLQSFERLNATEKKEDPLEDATESALENATKIHNDF